VELGMSLPHHGQFASTEAIGRVAQAAEQLGLGSLWVLERLMRPVGPVMQGGRPTVLPDYYGTVFDPIESLTYAAAKTSRIKLGTSIIDVLFHAPVVLGRRFATLDQLSGGRVIAGLGQGWMEEEFRAANVPMKRRGAGFGEYIEALRAIWGPDPVEFHGRFYEIAPSEMKPKPVQAGGPPILVAANSPASLARSARLADGINPFFFNRDAFKQMLDGYRKLVADAGRDPKRQWVVIRANREITDAPLEQRGPLNGSVEQVLDDLRWLRALDVHTVFFDMNQAHIPIDKQLGTIEQLQRGLQAG
jgi:probable F420-dependent oxidoreductase